MFLKLSYLQKCCSKGVHLYKHKEAELVWVVQKFSGRNEYVYCTILADIFELTKSGKINAFYWKGLKVRYLFIYIQNFQKSLFFL